MVDFVPQCVVTSLDKLLKCVLDFCRRSSVPWYITTSALPCLVVLLPSALGRDPLHLDLEVDYAVLLLQAPAAIVGFRTHLFFPHTASPSLCGIPPSSHVGFWQRWPNHQRLQIMGLFDQLLLGQGSVAVLTKTEGLFLLNPIPILRQHEDGQR